VYRESTRARSAEGAERPKQISKGSSTGGAADSIGKETPAIGKNTPVAKSPVSQRGRSPSPQSPGSAAGGKDAQSPVSQRGRSPVQERTVTNVDENNRLEVALKMSSYLI